MFFLPQQSQAIYFLMLKLLLYSVVSHAYYDSVNSTVLFMIMMTDYAGSAFF